MTPKLDFKVTELPITIDALDVLCVQLTRDLFAIAVSCSNTHANLLSLFGPMAGYEKQENAIF